MYDKYLNSTVNFISPIDVMDLARERNIYEIVSVISCRANQINTSVKGELNHYTEELYFLPDSMSNDTVDVDMQERIKICERYEEMPKPVSIALDEFCCGALEYRYRGDG